MLRLIFKGKTFIGYSTNKKLMKRFLKERGSAFNIHGVKKKYIKNVMDKDIKFVRTELIHHEESNRVMFEYEIDVINSAIHEVLIAFMKNYQSIEPILKCVRFTNEEKHTILSFMRLLKLMFDDLVDRDEQRTPYDSYIDVKSIVNIILPSQ